MKDKFTNEKLWDNVINETIKDLSEDGKSENIEETYSKAIKFKTQELLAGINENLREFSPDSAIQLKGDDVLVNGKIVGQLKIDHNNLYQDMVYVDNDGETKTFENAEDMYEYIAQKYNITEYVIKSPIDAIFESYNVDVEGEMKVSDYVLSYATNDDRAFNSAIKLAESKASLTEWTQFTKVFMKHIANSKDERVTGLNETINSYDSKSYVKVAKALRENFVEFSGVEL